VCSGLGLQRYAAAAQLTGYYVIGAPTGAMLAFGAYSGERDGVFGLWLGIALAMLAGAALQAVALKRHDWARAASAAASRLSTDGESKGGALAELGGEAFTVTQARGRRNATGPCTGRVARPRVLARRTASDLAGVPLRMADECAEGETEHEHEQGPDTCSSSSDPHANTESQRSESVCIIKDSVTVYTALSAVTCVVYLRSPAVR
jgi:hypothetical protein